MITNEGKTVDYMPLINKTYTKDDFYKSLEKPLPDPITKTHFTFSEKFHDYPDQQIQLVKYKTSYQMGYPRNEPNFGWQKDYGGAGIFTDRSPYKKVFINPWKKLQGRVTEYQILQKERLFIQPTVLAHTDQEILISFKPTPADDENYQLQILNANNGEIIRTLNLENIKYVRSNNFIFNEGYIIESDKYLVIDKNGTLVSKFYIYDILINPKTLGL